MQATSEFEMYFCYRIPAPLVPGVPNKPRLDSSIKKFNPHLISDSGFGSGNVFINGVHLAPYDLRFGSCAKPPKGGFGNWPDATYVWEMCERPSQDCYHVPPEWLQDNNVILVWSEPKLPPNVTAINPKLASIVYRIDPTPAI